MMYFSGWIASNFTLSAGFEALFCTFNLFLDWQPERPRPSDKQTDVFSERTPVDHRLQRPEGQGLVGNARRAG